MLSQLVRFYLERDMKLIKVYRAIRFKSSPYVANPIANDKAKRQQFKLDDIKTAFYKLINYALYGKTIENVARRTDNCNCLLNYMEKARRFGEKPHCVDFRIFDGQVAPPEDQVEAAIAKQQQQQETLVGIEMRKINYFINLLFANCLCVLIYNKLKCIRFVYISLYLKIILTSVFFSTVTFSTR